MPIDGIPLGTTACIRLWRWFSRPLAAPAVGGNLRVASFNVWNYFTTIDTAGAVCGPLERGCRGADSASELNRQREKSMAALDAHILGIVEVENDACTPLQNLVNGLNAAGHGPYNFIGIGFIGTHAIRVGLIYQTEAVAPAGSYRVLDNSVDIRVWTTRNRPALAQTFRHLATGDALTVVVNHFKSKGASCDEIGDSNKGDGQGNCNGIHTLGIAEAMINWLVPCITPWPAGRWLPKPSALSNGTSTPMSRRFGITTKSSICPATMKPTSFVLLTMTRC